MQQIAQRAQVPLRPPESSARIAEHPFRLGLVDHVLQPAQHEPDCHMVLHRRIMHLARNPAPLALARVFELMPEMLQFAPQFDAFVDAVRHLLCNRVDVCASAGRLRLLGQHNPTLPRDRSTNYVKSVSRKVREFQ